MQDDGSSSEKTTPRALTAFDDAREIVRLIQCARCSKPFRTPITLPCGRSLCKACLPEAHDRESMSYPDLPGRCQGVQCPFPECGLEHPASDCNIDVTLAKLMESITEIVVRQNSAMEFGSTSMEEVVRPSDLTDSEVTSEKPRVHEGPGTRLVATFSLAAQGLLDYKTDLSYHTASEASDIDRAVDVNVLQEIFEATQKELECQVCYSLMYDPVTTFCGHTHCRQCLARVLDHSLCCPVCRRVVSISSSLARQPSNQTLVDLLNGLCPEMVAARAEAVASEESIVDGDVNVPLFVCTLGFPNQPTFLRVFEPRYRLLLRRCLQGNQQFGMVMYNRYNEPQGDLGSVHFYHYGTMVQIIQAQLLPDGTSLVESRGTYRFRVTSHSIVDGYSVGNVERFDDVDLAEEERIEAEETLLPPAEEGDIAGQADRMSTQDLLALGQQFIVRMQNRSANWLQQRVLDVHGQPPDDAALFPYWFASVLPINDEEKYKLLETRTVRERLKITASWIRRIESQRW